MCLFSFKWITISSSLLVLSTTSQVIDYEPNSYDEITLSRKYVILAEEIKIKTIPGGKYTWVTNKTN